MIAMRARASTRPSRHACRAWVRHTTRQQLHMDITYAGGLVRGSAARLSALNPPSDRRRERRGTCARLPVELRVRTRRVRYAITGRVVVRPLPHVPSWCRRRGGHADTERVDSGREVGSSPVGQCCRDRMVDTLGQGAGAMTTGIAANSPGSSLSPVSPRTRMVM